MERICETDCSDLKKYLRGALPQWRVSQLLMAEKKLRTIGIETVSELLRVLKLSGEESLNEQLRRHGERDFTAETLEALRSPSKPCSAPVANIPSSSLPHQKVSTVSTEGEQKRHALSLRERFLAAKKQATPTVVAVEEQSNGSSSTKEARGPAVAAMVAKKARAQLEEEIEIATGQLEEAQESGDWQAWAARKADVERLNLKLEALMKDMMQERNDGSTTKEQASEASEWFEVAFSKVFVKKYPSDKAATWGWVLRGQGVEVLPTRAVDEHGREWIELTLFELWRSCMRDPPLKYEDQRNARGFCLVDAASEGLGILMRGPIARRLWPALDASQVASFHSWCGVSHRRSRNDLQVVGPASSERPYPSTSSRDDRAQLRPSCKGVQAFEVAHAGLQVYERATASSRVLGEKTRGQTIECDLGSASAGWVRLAGERGWVLSWMLRPRSTESDQQQPESLGVKPPVRYSMAKTPDLGQGLVADVRESLKLVVASVVGDSDLDSDFADPSSLQKGPHLIYELEAAIARAKACNVQGSIVEDAERHLEALSREGEPNRRRRLLRARLAKVISAHDAREIAKRADFFDFPDISEEAQLASRRFEETEAKAKDGHASLLHELASAVAVGDHVAIKAARNAAKAAGVPKRDLARVFALAQS